MIEMAGNQNAPQDERRNGGGTGKILLAEDDPNDVILFQRDMERASLSADSLKVVRDGEEAISFLIGTPHPDSESARGRSVRV
jgi:hypothetical protein